MTGNTLQSWAMSLSSLLLPQPTLWRQRRPSFWSLPRSCVDKDSFKINRMHATILFSLRGFTVPNLREQHNCAPTSKPAKTYWNLHQWSHLIHKGAKWHAAIYCYVYTVRKHFIDVSGAMITWTFHREKDSFLHVRCLQPHPFPSVCWSAVHQLKHKRSSRRRTGLQPTRTHI